MKPNHDLSRRSTVKELDRIISRSLRLFLDYINRKHWTGRENEAVSLYAFGFLQKECSARGPLFDPTQIGIEVGAANTKKSRKSQVRKDLVIWRTAGANRWYPQKKRSEPLAILEWKVRRPGVKRRPTSRTDIDWLSRHCRRHKETLGYAILLDLKENIAKLSVIRVDALGLHEIPI